MKIIIASFISVLGIPLLTLSIFANFAVFHLFFGVTALEAFQTANWAKAAVWAAIGTVFLLADNLKNDDVKSS